MAVIETPAGADRGTGAASSREVRVGILGAGGMGRTHGEVFSSDPRVRIAGVADVDGERAARLAADLGTRPHPTLKTLLAEGIDLLVVTTPNRHHAEASALALESGVGVLSEKPMAITLDEARRLCELARRPGAFFVVGHNRRHAPVYRRVREILAGGFRPLLANIKMHEGDYRTPPWVTDPRVSGGFLYENIVHFFDLMEWVIGPVAQVCCLARKPFYPDLNDFVISVAFTDGAIAALTATGHASWLHPAEKTELVGDHAAIVVEELDRVVHSPGDGIEALVHDYSPLPRAVRWGYRDQNLEIISSYLTRERPCFSPRRALRTLEIAEACLQSARDGRPVPLPPPPLD